MSWMNDPYWPKTQAEFDAYRKAMENADEMVMQSAKKAKAQKKPATKKPAAKKK